jgi:AcrR family transcriptional regulator
MPTSDKALGGQSAAANVDALRRMARAASSSSRLTVKGRATRARIIDAAAQLMYEKGAANTSFEDVRKAAKASGSQMSHYFADKRSQNAGLQVQHGRRSRPCGVAGLSRRLRQAAMFCTLASMKCRW